MMAYRDFLKRVLLVTLVVLLLLGFWRLHSTVMLAFTAGVIAVALNIPASWLQERWRWPRGLAILTSVVVALVIVSLMIVLLLPALVRETVSLFQLLPEAIINGADAYNRVRETNDLLRQFLPALSVEGLASNSQELLDTAISLLGAGVPVVFRSLGVVGTLVANILLVLVVSLFFLIDPLAYVKASLYLVPRRDQSRLLATWETVHATLRTWLSAQMVSILITVVLVWLVLGLIMGMPNAGTVAVFAGFATLIPNIGSVLPLIPITIFTLASEPALFVWVAPAYLIIQLVESNVLTPAVVRAQLNIPSGGLLLTQIVAASLFGALGVLLAVPLLAVSIALVRELYSFGLLGLRDYPVRLVRGKDGRWSVHELVALEEDTREELVDAG